MSPDARNVYVASLSSHAVVIFDRDLSTGELTQKEGQAGCIGETGSSACADGVALGGALSVAVSPDGLSVYVAALASDALAVFDRDPSTGALTQKAGLEGCLSETGTGGACAVGKALDEASSVAVTPDGRSVYVASQLSDAIAVFDRDVTSGALTQKSGLAGCSSETGTGGACTEGVALDRPESVVVSPDGRSVYVTSFLSDAVAVFSRDPEVYDIDGDGEVQPLTDGLLFLRHSFGFTGGPLVDGVVDLADCTRCTAGAIEAYLQAMLGPPV